MITKEEVALRSVKHFSLGELIFSLTASFHGLGNIPSFKDVDNLLFTAKILEVVREHIGKPITVDSGFRSESLNKLVGGVSNSLHLSGNAVDFTINGFTDDDFLDLHAWIFSQMPWLSECFYYPSRNFIHLAYSPTKTMPCFKIISNPKNIKEI